MTKRTISVILILLMLLPTVILAGSVLFALNSPFADFDRAWENSLSDSLSSEDFGDSGGNALPDGDRYIVKFKADATLAQIENALTKCEYRLLSESKNRLFALIPDEGFFENNKNIIEYSECDLVRETLATTNDPAPVPSHRSNGINSAWDVVTAKSDVIVAVLDTGVDRTHEDLLDAKILNGYDAVARKAGVNGDAIGHGTGVIGLIAATANNGKGIAGVAYGTTILPIRVSSSGSMIYSSDLIAGIRFAADAGAKIINMSVGGYSSSVAEQEAINYAISKGCILIAAAGNDGVRPYGTQKSYPASYDGVISVASCDENGEVSGFSQKNDAVDVAAVGENLPLLFVENGRSVYKYDSGTSFSCAIVSGIAALAVSHNGNSARFGNDEFLALISDTLGKDKNESLGHGMIDARSIIDKTLLPIITGVTDRTTYSSSVTIGFNRGSATLDGEPISDQTTVFSYGVHTLRVTDGDFEREIAFALNYNPLSFEFKEFSDFSCFEFSRGSGFLDGFPYQSGEKITSSGKHVFVLTDGDEKLTETVYIGYKLPEVFGVSDGESYDRPVYITILGNGKATLDGKEIDGAFTVASSGSHTLSIQSKNGAAKQTISFNIDFAQGDFKEFDLADARAAVDSENGYLCLYSESLVGVRIYDMNAPEKYLHFLNVGEVYSHQFTETELLLFGENGVTVLDRATAKDGMISVGDNFYDETIDIYCFADGEIYGFGSRSFYKLNRERNEHELITELGFEVSNAIYSDGKILLTPNDGESVLQILTLDGNELSEIDIGVPVLGAPTRFENNYISVGNRLFSAGTHELLLEFNSNSAVLIENDRIYTEKYIIDIKSGKELARLPFEVASITKDDGFNLLFGFDSIFAKIDATAEGFKAFGAAEISNHIVGEHERINPYRESTSYLMGKSVISVAASQSTTYLLFADSNALYPFETKTRDEKASVSLKYVPHKVTASDGFVAVSFKNAPYIYLASEDDLQNGRYIDFVSPGGEMFILNNRIYAVSNGSLKYCALDGVTVFTTQIKAAIAKTDGKSIFALNGNTLSVYGLNHTVTRQIAVNGQSLYVGNGVTVGKTLYLGNALNERINLGASALAMKGNTLVTESGVFSVSEKKYVGDIGVDAELATISEGNSLISFGDGMMSVCFYENGDEVVTLPTVEGVESGKIYVGSTTIGFSHGIGYLDGQKIESDASVSTAGEHIFAISLPCGNLVSYKFIIEAQVSGISFLSPMRVLSVGESVTLRIKYSPDGASSLPVTFKCESDGLTIDENGVVTANRVGRYTVTATVSADYGSFNASCFVTVRDDLIIFPEESGITVDRDREFVLGIAPNTKASQIKQYFGNGKTVRITDTDGKSVNGIVATGHKISLIINSEQTDILTAVVTGDTDGDGLITAYDLFTQEKILRGATLASHFHAAADMNKNGVLADNDRSILRSALLGIGGVSLGTPQENLFGSCSAQMLSHVEEGEIIDIALYVSGSKYARAVNGLIGYSGLEYVSAESLGWDIGVNAHDGKINFYGFGSDGSSCGKAYWLLINFKFRVTAKEGEEISIFADNLTFSFPDGSKNVRFTEKRVTVSGEHFGDFDIKISNAYSFKFDPSQFEYDIVIPYNSAMPDIEITHGEGLTHTISDLVIDTSGSGTVIIRLDDEDGTSRFYHINVKRDREPEFDTNCHLGALEVEGFKLNPHFSPEITDYSITVPFGTEKINIYCVAQNETAQVFIGDTTLYDSENEITVTVVAPDGEKLVYTINVTVLPEGEIPSDDDDSNNKLATICVVAFMLFAVSAIPFSFKKVK